MYKCIFFQIEKIGIIKVDARKPLRSQNSIKSANSSTTFQATVANQKPPLKSLKDEKPATNLTAIRKPPVVVATSRNVVHQAQVHTTTRQLTRTTTTTSVGLVDVSFYVQNKNVRNRCFFKGGHDKKAIEQNKVPLKHEEPALVKEEIVQIVQEDTVTLEVGFLHF